jgi:SNF2 family DNA or RNA helicase
MVVIDEASGFKDPGTRRFKALARIRAQVERLIELTGTPAPNSLLELWPQVYLLDRGARLGRAFSAFREAWFESDYMGWRWTPRPGAEAEIQRRVEDLALTLKAEDWLALPERVDRVLAVPLPAEARARYRRLERELVLELGEARITAVNAGVLAGKLLQAANGALYAEDGEWHLLHDAKLEALEDLLEATEGEPVLVAYAYRSDRERLLARFPQAVELRAPGAIDAWNRGEAPILLAHPASGGHGLNLQAGGRHVVWWGLTWSLELYQQLTARLHRQGQTRPVLVHHLVAEGTLDETVMAALAGKAATQAALLEAVRRRWASLLRGGGVKHTEKTGGWGDG